MKLTETSQRGRSEDRNALRRTAGRKQGQGEPEVDEIRKLTDELPTLPQRMGIGALGAQIADAEERDEVEIIVDPDVMTNVEAYTRGLANEATAGAEVQAVLKRMAGRSAKWDPVQAALFTAEQLDSDLSDTDRWAGREEQRLQGELFHVLDRLLDGTIGNLTPAERDRLRGKAQQVLALRAQAQEEQQKEKALTTEAQAAAEMTLAEGQAEAHMLRTARDLYEDRPVDEGDLDTALATFAALTEKTSDPASGRRSTRR